MPGKIHIGLSVSIEDKKDLARWYTPGVADESRAITEDPDKVFEITWKENSVAIVSDGTRVLGLGNIGPEAALPVMEGKAALFKRFGGVDAVPIVINEREEEKICALVNALAPGFGGINLEDIETPKVFYIYERLRKELEIPMWHDDQHGTAVAILAGLINACKIVEKELTNSKIVLYGFGAANYATYNLLKSFGVKPKQICAIDSKGVLSVYRENLPDYKKRVVDETGCTFESIEEAFDGADILIAASRPGPGVIKPEWITRMEKPITFLLANPVPEIPPEEAKKAGAVVVATGRSDLPNQINNALAFPGVFRGALDARARGITERMMLRAAEEIASVVEPTFDQIVPTIFHPDLHIRVAAAVADEAVKEGIARRKLKYDEELEYARRRIFSARAGI